MTWNDACIVMLSVSGSILLLSLAVFVQRITHSFKVFLLLMGNK